MVQRGPLAGASAAVRDAQARLMAKLTDLWTKDDVKTSVLKP